MMQPSRPASKSSELGLRIFGLPYLGYLLAGSAISRIARRFEECDDDKNTAPVGGHPDRSSDPAFSKPVAAGVPAGAPGADPPAGTPGEGLWSEQGDPLRAENSPPVETRGPGYANRADSVPRAEDQG